MDDGVGGGGMEWGGIGSKERVGGLVWKHEMLLGWAGGGDAVAL